MADEVRIRLAVVGDSVKMFIDKVNLDEKKYYQLMASGVWREVKLYEVSPDDSFEISGSVLRGLVAKLDSIREPA